MENQETKPNMAALEKMAKALGIEVDEMVEIEESASEEIQQYRLLTADQIRHRLRDRRLSYVAEHSNLTYMSLSRLQKRIGNPSMDTVEKLSKYFNVNP